MVVSETRKPGPHGAVVQWPRDCPPTERYISAVTLGQLQRGVESRRRHDPVDARRLEHFADDIAAAYRVLDMDGRCFRHWSRLMIGKSGHLAVDGMIAATAIVHDLTVVTRNVKDFIVFGLQPTNPFVDLR